METTYRMIDEIIPEILYLGCEGAATHRKDLLEKFGVKSILNCQSDPVNSFPTEFKYYVIHVEDKEEENIGKYFSETFEIIEKAKKPIFVHCFAGVSRSSSVVIAYLMKKRSLSFSDAFEYVKKRRPQIDPNPGFRKQLQLYEKEMENGKFQPNDAKKSCIIL